MGAMRYQPEVAPFGAIAEQTPSCVQQLAQLMSSGEEVCLLDQEANLADLFEVVSRYEAVQMVHASKDISLGSVDDIRRLTAADLPEMTALIEAVFPGYFRPRTIELGKYYGVFIDGHLAAMAGERLSVPGMREISSICTHTVHQGRGLAGRLTQFLTDEIRRSGSAPFLHVGSHNDKAKRLYGKLGFDAIRVAQVNLYRKK